MKKSSGIVVGMLTAGALAGAIYASNRKNMRSTKKKMAKALNKTLKNAESFIDDISAMLK
jgi:hypothetical protein